MMARLRMRMRTGMRNDGGYAHDRARHRDQNHVHDHECVDDSPSLPFKSNYIAAVPFLLRRKRGSSGITNTEHENSATEY